MGTTATRAARKKPFRWWIPVVIFLGFYALFPNVVEQAWCTNITNRTWISTTRFGDYDEPEIVEEGVCLNDQELRDFNQRRSENESVFP